ncbi:uncharacterized protein LOC114175169 [Vigna unguiculata]|uniref:uncharacterized protein LOC114175169 n=1 Tax=Vigna unguiculata TaxID=3917 RepID=UPI0010171ED3|nr:uncharacterized protein LOC114175169 [Vigna unguiculata]
MRKLVIYQWSEHKDFWALKTLNFDLKDGSVKRKFQIHELEELRMQFYESASIYKRKMKAYHGKKILKREFKLNQLVMLFNSRLRRFLEKLKSKWFGPFIVKPVKQHGAIEIEDQETKRSWLVNGQRLKEVRVVISQETPQR